MIPLILILLCGLAAEAGERAGFGSALLFSVNHQFVICRLPGLNLYGLWLITRAEQSVRSWSYIELDHARAVSCSRRNHALVGGVQNGHLVSTQSGIGLGQLLH